MKTRLEIISEIIFLNGLCKALEEGGENKSGLYYLYTGRVIALRWVINEPTCLIEELEYELTKDES